MVFIQRRHWSRTSVGAHRLLRCALPAAGRSSCVLSDEVREERTETHFKERLGILDT